MDTLSIEQLWQRGAPGDDALVERLRAESPAASLPASFHAPEGARLHAWLTPSQKEAAVELLVPTYWNAGVPRDEIAIAVSSSTANVGATDASGVLVAHARALSDRSKYAWVYDVIVAEVWRGRGLGQALMRLLLDHPAVRNVAQVLLATRDAQPLYAKFGFIDRASAPNLRTWRSTEMVLRRRVPKSTC